MHIWFKFGDSSRNPLKVIVQTKFLEFWVKMAKINLKVKVNDLHFQYQLRVSQMFGANLVIVTQIYDE